MPRLVSALFCAVALLTTACQKRTPEQPEPAGSLEGTWRLGLTEPVIYDRQNQAVATYPPQAGILPFTQVTFTGTDLTFFHEQSTLRTTTAYVHAGDQVTCPLPFASFTIRKLTTRQLDLYQRGEYLPIGANSLRTDYLMHFERL
ncbi:hypothetical protein I2I05_17450 [Hymenobacter sp. BT683]|uniref:Lipocalin-like domain-containing protein n=1 Tax=Hymenobacter jeongseonensis TaxID=2791027 RepID=A0ABS0IME3_9BACT|nr:hypothetical protein [Hymenobacter jeongseonensis]MBF9239194.1 hypothetical protein [Hymenobacter jeongseonensis]